MEEFRADPAVHANPARHVLHVGADLFAQVRHFVDEGDLRREEGVGGVFDQLARPAVDDQQRRFVEEERTVDLGHHFAAEIVLRPDHDPVGALEVADGCAFAQEFGIGNDGHLQSALRHGGAVRKDALDLVARADRHGRLGHHDGVVGQRVTDFARDCVDVGEVRMAVAPAAGRAHCNEDGGSALDAFSKIGGEREAARLHIAFDQRIQPGFVDRHDTVMQLGDLCRVLVDAHDIVTEIGETRARYQADIAAAHHSDLHCRGPLLEVFRLIMTRPIGTRMLS